MIRLSELEDEQLRLLTCMIVGGNLVREEEGNWPICEYEKSITEKLF